MEKKVILYDNPEAAKPITLDLFQSLNGTYHLTEEGARKNSQTHKTCECGNIIEKNSYCKDCAKKRSIERYYKMPFKEWDGKGMVYSEVTNEFYTEDSLSDYFVEKEEEAKEEGKEYIAEDLMLVICEENHYRELESSYWEDIYPENCDEIPELENLIKEFNEKLSKLPSPSYEAGRFRTK